MRLLLCALIGCGGLELYDAPPLQLHVHDAPTTDPVPWTGPDDDDAPQPGTSDSLEGPTHLLRLSGGFVPLVPELEVDLAPGNDLVFQLDFVDPPLLAGRMAAVTATGAQDYCVPTLDVSGRLGAEAFRVSGQGYQFQASELPWRALRLEGSLTLDEIVDAVLYVELPAADVPLDDACDVLACRPCSVLPGVEAERCAIVPIELESEPLPAFVVEPLTLGDALAACP